MFKVGDKVICVGDYEPDDNPKNGGGHGFEKGKVIKITEIYDTDELYCIYYLLYSLDKTKEKHIVKAINTFLKKKQNEVQTWIIKKLSV